MGRCGDMKKAPRAEEYSVKKARGWPIIATNLAASGCETCRRLKAPLKEGGEAGGELMPHK